MSSGEKLIAPVEPVPEKLDAETSALIGDFVLSIMRADYLFAALSSEVTHLRSKKVSAGRTLYAAMLVAICSAEARGRPLAMNEVAGAIGVDRAMTAPRYLQYALDAKHVMRYDDPGDKRRVLLRPSKRAMDIFEKEIPAIARIASKLKTLKAEDVANLRELVE